MSERDPRLYCDDILESGSAILDFVKGLSFEDFCDDRKTYSAVIREFEIIGEAVHNAEETDFFVRGSYHRQYKKSIRRHHRARIINKRLKRVREGRWFVKSPGYLGKNNTVCSCAMCGNRRKYFGEVTRQEKIAEIQL